IENFGDELSEVRRLGWVELSAAILARISPRVRRRAHEPPGRLVIAEGEELHHDDLVDDGADLARDFRALHLQAKLDEAAEAVGDLFENADKDYVLAADVLQLVQPHQHFASVCPVNVAQILRAGALRTCFRLLLSMTK